MSPKNLSNSKTDSTDVAHKKARKKRKRVIQTYKTLFLAIFAIVSFILACLYSLDIAPNIVWGYFLACVIFVLAIMLVAFFVVALIALFKRSQYYKKP